MNSLAQQSIKNTIITYIGFGLGAINTLFLFTALLSKQEYGLVSLILSVANLLTPLLSMGVQDTLLRFYFHQNSTQKQQLLSLSILLPLCAIGTGTMVLGLWQTPLQKWLSAKNPEVGGFLWSIFTLAILMAYFEIFCAWAKVHFRTSEGMLLREVYPRVLSMLLLGGIFTGSIGFDDFIPLMLWGYVGRTLLMAILAFGISPFVFTTKIPPNAPKIIRYGAVLLLSSSVSVLLIDIDKFMLGQLLPLEQIAIYSVAVYMASVIAVPQRAMYQIIRPKMAQLMSTSSPWEIAKLFTKGSQAVIGISCVVFIMVITNAHDLYRLIPTQGYQEGFVVLITMALVKLLDSTTALSNAILFNATYYRYALYLAVILLIALIGLNLMLIPRYGINGAAAASLLAFVGYNLMKIAVVYKYQSLHPFSPKNILILLISLSCTALLLEVKMPFCSLCNITLRSLGILTMSILAIKWLFPEYFRQLCEQCKKLLR